MEMQDRALLVHESNNVTLTCKDKLAYYKCIGDEQGVWLHCICTSEAK
jgi:hypothetical protein